MHKTDVQPTSDENPDSIAVDVHLRGLHDQTDIPCGRINPPAPLERAGLVRHKGDYWAAADDDRIAAATASVLGLAAVAETYDDDWYARNEGWSEDLEDLSDEEA